MHSILMMVLATRSCDPIVPKAAIRALVERLPEVRLPAQRVWIQGDDPGPITRALVKARLATIAKPAVVVGPDIFLSALPTKAGSKFGLRPVSPESDGIALLKIASGDVGGIRVLQCGKRRMLVFVNVWERPSPVATYLTRDNSIPPGRCQSFDCRRLFSGLAAMHCVFGLKEHDEKWAARRYICIPDVSSE